ncbi:DUF1007 family protein [Phreatobacter sp.]|uniref:DUF1007 family protein n=1 Tax=Phreatobacter sp. TaxID=1966341 RepID=UPI003F704CCF
MFRSRLALIYLFVLALAAPARAHPHVEVQTSAELIHDDKGQVMAIRHAWAFDELYSSFATQGLDANRDGVFSREELAELTRVNVEHLGQQRFFTVMRHERRHVSFGEVRDAWSEVVGGKLVLRFTVPVATPFQAAGRPVTLQIYDPDYFVAFVAAEGEPLRLVSAPQGCRLDYTPPRGGERAASTLSESFFQALGPGANFGQQFAGLFTVTCP